MLQDSGAYCIFHVVAHSNTVDSQQLLREPSDLLCIAIDPFTQAHTSLGAPSASSILPPVEAFTKGNAKGKFLVPAVLPKSKKTAVNKVEKPQTGNFRPLTPEFLAYFASRGISEKTLQRNQVAQESTWMPGQPAGDAIAFPYLRNGEVVNVKYRTMNKCFRQVKGAEKILYGLDDAVGQDTIIIVEGDSLLHCVQHACHRPLLMHALRNQKHDGWTSSVQLPNAFLLSDAERRLQVKLGCVLVVMTCHLHICDAKWMLEIACNSICLPVVTQLWSHHCTSCKMSCLLNGASHFNLIYTVDYHTSGVCPSIGVVLPAMHDKLLISQNGGVRITGIHHGSLIWMHNFITNLTIRVTFTLYQTDFASHPAHSA